MEEKLSFIPKKNITIAPLPKVKTAGLGPVVVFSFVMFLVSGMMWGGLIVYKKSLSDQKSQLVSSLEKVKSSMEMPLVDQIIGLSNRTDSAGKVLTNHRIVSPVFVFLEENTVKNVRFNDLKYGYSEKDGHELVMAGVAKSYSDLALQAESFEKSDSVQSVSFSGLALDEKGGVKFDVKMVMNPSMFAYK